MAKICGVIVLLMFGCSTAVESQPEVKPVDTESFISSVNVQAKAIATTLAAQKLTGEMTLENTHSIIDAQKQQATALAAIKGQIDSLEASVVSSKPNGKEVIQSSEPPAKANTTPDPLKVATPAASSRTASDGTVLRWNIEGNWDPTILETSQHLGQDHGIDTNGMTHQQMADLHASIHDGTAQNGGQPVSGGIFPNNRASAITSQRVSVRSVPQRVSFFGRTKYQTRQSCPSGRCPQR
jgi:hypothetical protein